MESLFSLKNFQKMLRRGDIAFALGLMAILIMLIAPLPSWLLDISLAFSITFSILVLMTALFIEKPLEFSAFPTVLLISTMLRLALNVASTRLILTYGHKGHAAAGKIIAAFGHFVMSGSFIIGLIVFTILVIVNFVVITKGSGRIAEVSARFSLDAMPGKQMAIDADLSAGIINENEAKARRRELEEESSFFGAMDGAAKFVRGDAIAGLLITFINIIGGIIIGVLQKGLTFLQAAETYTILTVGDGLVSQVPALIISTAAGLLVSKAGVIGSAEKALFGQLQAYPTALGISSGLMTLMALMPGMPALPFLMLGAICGAAAWNLSQKPPPVIGLEAPEQPPVLTPEETLNNALRIDQIRLELGYGLVSIVNGENGFGLADQIKVLRHQLASEMGFVLPSVRLQDNLELPANTYSIRIKELEAARGELRMNMLLVMDPEGKTIALNGEATQDPTFGLPAMWIPQNGRGQAENMGYTIVDSATVLTTHLAEVIKDNIQELLSFGEIERLLESLDKAHQKILSDLVPAQINLSVIQRVLQNLLMERISIRDLGTILEAISEACVSTRNLSLITEHVRSRLARQLSFSNVNHESILPLVTLSPEWEKTFSEAIVGEGDQKQLAMMPSRLQEFIKLVRQNFDHQNALGENPVLLTTPTIRPFLRSVVERFRPSTVILSQNEIHPKVKIKTVGQIH